MTGIRKMESGSISWFRALMGAMALGAMLFASACGGDSTPPSVSSQYPSGMGGDIEKQLKYDARVEDFRPNGDTLVVIVNDSWLSSPPGMRARALGQWYSLWQPSHGAASKIIVEHEGTEVDSWTAEKGYQPADHEKKEASEG